MGTIGEFLLRTSAVVLLLLGAITALSGLTFALQGMGLVGPGSSFMYQNPLWVTQGELILVVGAVLILAALALNRQPAADAKP